MIDTETQLRLPCLETELGRKPVAGLGQEARDAKLPASPPLAELRAHPHVHVVPFWAGVSSLEIPWAARRTDWVRWREGLAEGGFL